MEVLAAGGIVVWGVLAALKVNPKAQYVLLALVGAGVSGGFLGTWLGRLGSWLTEASASGTGALLGVSLGWAIPYTIALWWVLVMWPNRIEPAGTATGKNSPSFGDWVHTTTLISSLFVVPSAVVAFVSARDAITSGNSDLIWGMIAAMGLSTWIVMALLQVHPKAQYIALTFFGAGASGGMVGSWLTTAGDWIGSAAGDGTSAAVGVSIGWALSLGIVVWYILVLLPHSIEPAGTATDKNAPSWSDWIHVTTLVTSVLFIPSFVILWNGAGAALSGLGA